MDAVGILPFNQFDDVFGLLDIFGKIGSYYARTKLDINQGAADLGIASESTTNNTRLHLGIDVNYYFTNKFGARIEWERFRKAAKDFNGESSTGSDVDMASIDFSYKF